MPIQFQEKMVRNGKAGTSTLTFTLIHYDQMDEKSRLLHGNQKPRAFADMMRCAKKPYLVWHSDLFPTEVHVPFEQFMNEYAGTDFENVFLRIETQFRIDC